LTNAQSGREPAHLRKRLLITKGWHRAARSATTTG
jgi:hypothetical protein